MDQPSNPIPESSLGKTFVASVAVLLAGLVLLWFSTAGGQGFTTETLRRQQVSSKPQLIDALPVTTADGDKTNLRALLAGSGKEGGKESGKEGGKVWLVDFVYTRCQTVCSSLGSIYQQLQRQIEADGLQNRVGLLSISIDPANDDPAALAAYALRMRMHPAIWQIASLANWQDRRKLLDTFGIIVIPAPFGEFEHNAALHVVTSSGRLIQIIDYQDFQTAVNAAIASGERDAAPSANDLRASR